MEANMNIEKRKKVIRRIALIFLLIILLLTFFSKTINNLLLPEVDCIAPYSGSLQKGIEVTGEVKHTDVAQVISNGNWLVNLVNVKVGDEVQKDDVLAVLDESMVALDLKNLQLEVMKLQNDLDNYKSSFDAIKPETYDKAAEKAKKELQKRRDKLETVKSLYETGAETSTSVSEAQDALENAEDDYNSKLELAEKMKNDKLEKSEEFNRTLKQKEFELQIKKTGLQNYTKELPKKGEIKAKFNGIVRSVSVQAGNTMQQGEVMFELVKDDGNTRVTWKMNGKKARGVNKGDDVTVNITEPEEKELKGIVENRKYIEQEGVYECTALIDAGDVQLEDGLQVNIELKDVSTQYDAIVPISSVLKDTTGTFIYAVETRKGALGEEKYVKKIDIKVLESDDFNSAVVGLENSEDLNVVSYSTKVLYKGVQVKMK